MTGLIEFIVVVSGVALIFALVLSAYSYFYGPLAWAEDSDVFALMEQWIFHPIGRQIHKVYPIYEEEEETFSDLVEEIEAEASPEELRHLEDVRAFYYNPVWDFPSFQPTGRPWDYELDGF